MIQSQIKILTENGFDFYSNEIHRDAFSITIRPTDVESQWCNGVCEWLNSLIGNCVWKVMADCKCDIEMTLV